MMLMSYRQQGQCDQQEHLPSHTPAEGLPQVGRRQN